MWMLAHYPAKDVFVVFLTPVFALLFGAGWLECHPPAGLVAALGLSGGGHCAGEPQARQPEPLRKWSKTASSAYITSASSIFSIARSELGNADAADHQRAGRRKQQHQRVQRETRQHHRCRPQVGAHGPWAAASASRPTSAWRWGWACPQSTSPPYVARRVSAVTLAAAPGATPASHESRPAPRGRTGPMPAAAVGNDARAPRRQRSHRL